MTRQNTYNMLKFLFKLLTGTVDCEGCNCLISIKNSNKKRVEFIGYTTYVYYCQACNPPWSNKVNYGYQLNNVACNEDGKILAKEKSK